MEQQRLTSQGVVEIKDCRIALPALENPCKSPALWGWELKQISRFEWVCCVGMLREKLARQFLY